MKLLLSFVLGIFLLSFAGNAKALQFDVGPHWDGLKDSTGWIKGFDKNAVPQVATGLCNGVFIKVKNGDKLVADLFSPCILGATTYEAGVENANDFIGGFKVIDFMGINGGVYYSPTNREPRDNWYSNFVYGFGITLMGFGENILK